MRLLPLLIIGGGIGFALYKASTAQAQAATVPSSTATSSTGTSVSLTGVRIPSGLTLSSADVETLRAILKGTDASAALRDIYGTDDGTARLAFVQVIVNRMAADHTAAYLTAETVLREFYAP